MERAFHNVTQRSCPLENTFRTQELLSVPTSLHQSSDAVRHVVVFTCQL